MWIYNESLGQNKKVKKEQVDDFLNQGWKLGRKMSFHKWFHGWLGELVETSSLLKSQRSEQGLSLGRWNQLFAKEPEVWTRSLAGAEPAPSASLIYDLWSNAGIGKRTRLESEGGKTHLRSRRSCSAIWWRHWCSGNTPVCDTGILGSTPKWLPNFNMDE